MITMLMAVELMLNSVNIVFVSFARFQGMLDGHIWVFMVLAVAAAEAAVGLGIIVALFRNIKTVYVDEVKELRG